jgi:hypothetical protein
MIPMGDLDLRHEVRQKAGSITTRRRRVKSSESKVYAARIHGSNTCMMAIIYQGYNAEEVHFRVNQIAPRLITFTAMADRDNTIFESSVRKLTASPLNLMGYAQDTRIFYNFTV